MTATIDPGFPLAWPQGRPRTAKPRPSQFRHEGRRMTFTSARTRLRFQVELVNRAAAAPRMRHLVLSTNIRFTLAGTRDQNVSRRDPDDAGVALYFDLDGKPHVLACDRWDTVYDNIAAIAAHIDALRGQERWGVADLREAFAGHLALPAPEPWWTVLGVTPLAHRRDIERAFRARARSAHPDAGGDRAAWDRLSAAYEAAKEQNNG